MSSDISRHLVRYLDATRHDEVSEEAEAARAALESSLHVPETPAGTPNLNKALAEFQMELPTVTKDRTATVKYRNSDQKYTYKYADLAAVVAVALPLLGKHGLSFSAFPGFNDRNEFVLDYTLLHESGEERSGQYRMHSGATAQDMGGEITYARRYTLCAVTGIAAEEDTDAQRSERSTERRTPTARGKAKTDDAGAPAKIQALADLAWGLGQQTYPDPAVYAKTLEDLKTGVYDVAAQEHWLQARVTSKFTGEEDKLVNVITAAKKQLEGSKAAAEGK